MINGDAQIKAVKQNAEQNLPISIPESVKLSRWADYRRRSLSPEGPVVNESPYTSPSVAEMANGTAPLRWQLGRGFAIGFAVPGLAFSVAGHLAGLVPGQAAGGECFGGGLLILSGGLLFILLCFKRVQLTVNFRFWATAAACCLVLGTFFVLSGYSTVQQIESERREIRKNLDLLKDATDAVQRSNSESAR